MTPRVLAPYVLRYLASAQRRGRLVTLDDVVAKIKVRRADVRTAISTLHAQGLLDATTLRLSLQGFAVGTALRAHKLPPIARTTPAATEGSGEHSFDTNEAPTGPRPVTLKRIAAA